MLRRSQECSHLTRQNDLMLPSPIRGATEVSISLGLPTWHTGEMQDDWQTFSSNTLRHSGKTPTVLLLASATILATQKHSNGNGRMSSHITQGGGRLHGWSPAEQFPTLDLPAWDAQLQRFIGLALDEEASTAKPRTYQTWLITLPEEFRSQLCT